MFMKKTDYPLEVLEIITRKVNPNNLKEFISQSLGSGEDNQPVYKFEPLIRYLEGYFYDNNGNLLANTLINIRLKIDNKKVGSFKTNENGYFKINSVNLPHFDYYFDYKNQDNKIEKLTTSKFIYQNKKYLIDNKINLIVDDKSVKLVDNKKNDEIIINKYSNNITENDLLNKQSKINTVKNKFKNLITNQFFIIFLILIFLIISVGITIYFYIKSCKF